MDDDAGFSIVPTVSNVVPFAELCDNYCMFANDFQRWQLPLRPASATTTHKMQGTTVTGNCVTLATDIKQRLPFTRGIDYVCHSRVRDLTSLFLVRALQPIHFTHFDADRKKVHVEYKRLRDLFVQE
jgi:hypothetical protein